MRIVRVDPLAPDPLVIGDAAAIIRSGGLVAFPTETVYGLGANALDAAAVERIYEAKGRPAHNPIIAHVTGASEAARVVRDWPRNAAKLSMEFWPGPLTLVLPKHPDLPPRVTAGLDTAAVRAPAHPVAWALINAAGVPIAAPSANVSNAVSPTTAEHVARSLLERIDMIIDAGPTSVGIESTVVDLTGELPVILRPGTISAADIDRIVGPLGHANAAHGTAPRSSPGQLDRHYSPRTPLVIAENAVADARARVGAGERVVALTWSAATDPAIEVLRLGGNAADYARALYAALHAVDARSLDAIVVERVPDDVSWDGVRDRLNRASGSRPAS